MKCNWVDKLGELRLSPLSADSFSPLTESELQSIEGSLGKRLPEQYRSFLARYGASDFEEYAVFATNEGGIAPGWFFGRDLLDAVQKFSERLPRDVIPINEDNAGNLICISLRDESVSTIYFQHHSQGVGEVPESPDDFDAAKMGTLDRLAPDFGEFICGLAVE